MKEFINKNKDYIIIGTVSLIAFIIGCLAINFWVSLIIIGLADIILFIPNLMKNRKKVEKGRHAALNKKIIIYIFNFMYICNISILCFLGIYSCKCPKIQT